MVTLAKNGALLFFLFGVATVLHVCTANDGDLLKVQVTQHRSCSSRGKKIIFPNFDQAPVVPDFSIGPNCYRMTGVVRVEAPITGRLYAYVEAKNGTTTPPVACRDQQPNGCRGIGSCIYCDLCSEYSTLKHNEVRVESKKGEFNCKTGLKVGKYDETSLVFCLPKLPDFLRAMGIERSSWDQFAGKQGATVFMVYHLFENVELNKLSPDKLRTVVEKAEGEIGCHRLVMNVHS